MYVSTQAPLFLAIYFVFIQLALASPLPQSAITDAVRNAADAVSAKYNAAIDAINAAKIAANPVNPVPGTNKNGQPNIPNMTTQNAKKWCESNPSACDKACTGALGPIAGVTVGPGGPLIAAVWCGNIKANTDCSTTGRNCGIPGDVLQTSDNTLKNPLIH